MRNEKDREHLKRIINDLTTLKTVLCPELKEGLLTNRKGFKENYKLVTLLTIVSSLTLFLLLKEE